MKAKSSLLIVALLMTSLPASYAATRTWDGGATPDNNWANAINWSTDAAPVPPNDDLIFTGTTQTTTNNNFAADSVFTAISFNNSSTGGSFTLGGNRITLNGGITTTGATGSPTQTISLDMILATSPTTSFTLALNNNVTVSGNITETGGAKPITVLGAGILTLTGSNTFSGDVNVAQAKLTVNSLANSGTASAIGTGSGISVGSGGSAATLEYAGTLAGGHSTNRTITLAGTTGGAFFTANGTGPVTYNGILAVNNSSSNKTLTLDGTSTAANTFASNISTGADKVTVFKSGAGTWTLSGNNTFTRGVTLQVGQLNINNASALGTGTFSISSNTTFDNTTGADIIMSTANAISVGRHFTFGGSKNLSFTGATTTFGVLENQTAYTWTLNGVNSTLNLGTLVNKNVFNPINLTVNGSGNKLILEGLDLRNDGTAGKSLFILGSANIDITGAVFDTNVANPSAFAYSGTGTLTLSGTNTYTGTTGVTAAGTLVVAKQASLYNSTTASWTPAKITVASGGILALGVGDAASGYFDAAAVGTFLNAAHMGNSTTTTGFKTGSILGFDTTNAGGSFTYTGNITNLGTSATNGLAKLGSGTLVLSGTNTYTGNTTINAGTLLVSAGSVNSTSGITANGSTSKFRYDSSTALTRNVAVTAGATFAYNSSGNYSGAFTQTSGKLGGTNWNGTLGGLTIGANQTITPGNSVGTASTTSQTWASLGSFDWEINKADGTAGLTAGGWDLLNLSSTLTISATSGSKFNINISSLGLDNLPGNTDSFADLTSYNWLFADSASAISGFSADKFTLNTSGFTNTFTGTFGIALGDTISGGDNTQLYITYIAVPEPSTWALLAASLTTVMVLRRRRQS